MSNKVDEQINTELARAFQQIVTAGWANLSDGNVEAPTGNFALIHIEPNELQELLDAVFGDETPDNCTQAAFYPGSYLLHEDSDGNATLTEWLTLDAALEVYNRAQREFALWCPTCPKCGNEGGHERSPVSNSHRCACGHIWDPTEGVETEREDMALEKVKAIITPGWRPEVESIEVPDEPEKHYLKCENCGEVFDLGAPGAAIGHSGENLDDEPCYDDHHKPTYTLVPESEAF